MIPCLPHIIAGSRFIKAVDLMSITIGNENRSPLLCGSPQSWCVLNRVCVTLDLHSHTLSLIAMTW